MLAIFIAVATVTAVHLSGSSPGGSCGVAAPVPTLSSQLAAIGGFDQPYDPNDVATLDSLATQAAAVSAHNLIGASPAGPVAVTALEATKPNALVIPLLYPPTSSNAGRIAGLAVFLRDCAGRVYYSSVADFTTHSPPVPSFPVVREEVAAKELGAASVQLVYTASPLAPLWRKPGTDDYIPAGPLYPG